MSASLGLARRNLVANRARFAASVGGVALALTLTLALDAIFAGVANQLTVYIDRSGADVWVAQKGVRNLHMVASALPETVVQDVAAIDGVAAASAILEVTDTITAGAERGVVYLIGLPPGAAMGGPWDVVAGSSEPGPGQIIVDRGFAERAGIGIGGAVTVMGREMRVGGLSRGTASLVNSVGFMRFEDFRALRNNARIVSYVLATVDPGVSPETVAADIEEAVPGVTAQSTVAFGFEERRIVMDMSADVIAIMNAVGFAVALAVVALTVYVSTLSRRREYGALKAIGARHGFLYRVVIGQAFLSVLAGFSVGVAFTLALATILPTTGLSLELAVTPESVAKVGFVALVIASLAAIIPIRAIASVDPAIVFRKGAAL